ncbi:uncharacterized protein LOC125047050 [Penaeus chinensis]|uniref:uncharacterized protein LOC125047050 n=1 Tax=Penaeus chinensis TaxID=139456 RepID=UPI001FB64E3E|nr:uncharacterized protein LOC125047050 [Penaeus chinensis]
MPGYYHEDQFGSGGGGSSRYRSGSNRGGRASGGYGRGGGGGASGGGGSYSRGNYSRGGVSNHNPHYSGGGSYSSNRHHGGGSHSGTGGYGDGGYGRTGHASSQGRSPNRYSGGMNSGSMMVNPWESGMVPTAGGGSGGNGLLPTPGGSGGSIVGGGGGGTSNLLGSLSQLSQMGNNESKLALNILNAVLSSGSSLVDGRDSRDYGPPANKMRRMDRGGGNDDRRGRARSPQMRPPPSRKLPQREHHFSPRRAWDEAPHSRRGRHVSGPAGLPMMNDYQLRKKVKARKGKPRPDAKDNKAPAKDQEKGKDETASTTAAETAAGVQEGVKAEGDGTPAAAGPNKSEGSEGPAKPDQVKGKEEPAGDEEANEGKPEGAEGGDGAEKGEGIESDEAKKALQKKTKEAKPREEIPREALKCHMCDLTKFGSIKGYLNHLESKNHEEMARLFHAKGVALLQLLRAESKLASLRNTVKLRKMGVKGRFMQCFRCQTRIFGNLAKHVKTTEHQLVSNFLNLKCCSRWFPSRVDLEEHRLSLLHLRRQYEFEQRKKAKEEKEKKEWEESKVPENAPPAWRRLIHQLDQLKTLHNHPSEMSLGTIPAYDPAAPTGLNFIGTKTQFYCRVCTDLMAPASRVVDAHCRSINHYNTLLSHLGKMEEKKELEKKKQKEEAKKEKEESDKKQSNGEEGDGAEVSFEDMDNMETVDEALDDADAEMDASADATSETLRDGHEGHEDELDIVHETRELSSLLEEVGEMLQEDEVKGDCEDGDMAHDMEDELMKDCDDAALKLDGIEGTTDKVNSQEDITAEAETETAVEGEPAEEEEVKGEDADVEDAKKTEEEGSKEEEETKEATDEDEAKEEEKPRAVSQSPSTPRGRRGRARGRGRSARGAKN